MYNPEQLPHDTANLITTIAVGMVSNTFGFIPEQIKITEIDLNPNDKGDFNIMAICFNVKAVGYNMKYAGNGKYKLQYSPDE
jgi:hypothetical protein